MSLPASNPSNNKHNHGGITIDTIPNDIQPALLIRLARQWTPCREEIDTGYVRSGYGWCEGISSLELRDSVRAWWRLSPATLKRRRITHVVAVAHGQTRALNRIEGLTKPRPRDGRYAFECTVVTSGELYEQWIGSNGKTVPFAPGSRNSVNYWPGEQR